MTLAYTSIVIFVALYPSSLRTQLSSCTVGYTPLNKCQLFPIEWTVSWLVRIVCQTWLTELLHTDHIFVFCLCRQLATVVCCFPWVFICTLKWNQLQCGTQLWPMAVCGGPVPQQAECHANNVKAMSSRLTWTILLPNCLNQSSFILKILSECM